MNDPTTPALDDLAIIGNLLTRVEGTIEALVAFDALIADLWTPEQLARAQHVLNSLAFAVTDNTPLDPDFFDDLPDLPDDLDAQIDAAWVETLDRMAGIPPATDL